MRSIASCSVWSTNSHRHSIVSQGTLLHTLLVITATEACITCKEVNFLTLLIQGRGADVLILCDYIENQCYLFACIFIKSAILQTGVT
jgi:hypothetical protein